MDAMVHSLIRQTQKVILGWPEKYEEIAKEVGMRKYVATVDDLLETVDKM